MIPDKKNPPIFWIFVISILRFLLETIKELSSKLIKHWQKEARTAVDKRPAVLNMAAPQSFYHKNCKSLYHPTHKDAVLIAITFSIKDLCTHLAIRQTCYVRGGSSVILLSSKLRSICKTFWFFFFFTFKHRGNFLCTQPVPVRFNKVIESDCYLSSKLSALEIWLCSRRV